MNTQVWIRYLFEKKKDEKAKKLDEINAQLEAAISYEEWKKAALEKDELLGKRNPHLQIET